jgi:hypothetical protein
VNYNSSAFINLALESLQGIKEGRKTKWFFNNFSVRKKPIFKIKLFIMLFVLMKRVTVSHQRDKRIMYMLTIKEWPAYKRGLS